MELVVDVVTVVVGIPWDVSIVEVEVLVEFVPCRVVVEVCEAKVDDVATCVEVLEVTEEAAEPQAAKTVTAKAKPAYFSTFTSLPIAEPNKN